MKGTQMHLFSNEEGDKANGKRHALVLPLDTTALLLVVAILMLALSFSLGVEKGRRNAMKSIEKERINLITEAQNQVSTQAFSQQVQQLNTLAATPNTEPSVDQTALVESTPTIAVAKPIPAIEPPAPIITTKPGEKKYIIQVASYTAKEPAEVAMKKIRSEGYPAFVAQKGKFLAILVGEFKDEKSAKSSFEALKRKYKDCILKKI
jgi:cell division septation protein DedD